MASQSLKNKIDIYFFKECITTSTVEANSLRHPQGDAAIATFFGRKQTARRTDALCDQGLRFPNKFGFNLYEILQAGDGSQHFNPIRFRVCQAAIDGAE